MVSTYDCLAMEQGLVTLQGPNVCCRIEGRMDQHWQEEIVEANLLFTVIAYSVTCPFPFH